MKKNWIVSGILITLNVLIASCSASPGSYGGGSSGSFSSDYVSAMILVPAGTFQYDGTPGDTNRISSSFHISEYDITRAEFSNVMGFDPSDTNFSTGKDDPVQMVNWYQALVFCNKLSMYEGLAPVYTIGGSTDPAVWGVVPTSDNAVWDAVTANWSAGGYRLPTDMEWMWAAMGADTANPGQINTTGCLKIFAGSTGSNNVDNYAWTTDNSSNTTHPVGSKLPNELGLYDMSGNVWQWCWDWYASYPGGALTDYKGAASSALRVLHGSCLAGPASDAAIVKRGNVQPSFQNLIAGFRVVRHEFCGMLKTGLLPAAQAANNQTGTRP